MAKRKGVLSDVAYTTVAETVRKEGSTTWRAEQREQRGLGLDPLVDPKAGGVIRRSLSRYEQVGDHFTLPLGVAMLEETRLDTTRSMGDNVDIAFNVLPIAYRLLSTGKSPVLGRYDVHMITSVFDDVGDPYVLRRSQAEFDERIAEQLTMMRPLRGGGDTPEDPQYGLFGGAYLTSSAINNYGLKYYDFTVSDAPGRHTIDRHTLVRVFGDGVFEKAAENGYQIDPHSIPSTQEVVRDLQQRAHAFFLQVGDLSEASHFWTRVMGGKEHVVVMPRTELLPYVKAVIIGLTEGVLDLQTVEEFLMENMPEGKSSDQFASRIVRGDARRIRHAVEHIPLGAQAQLPNYHKIPPRGSKFAKKGDLWPISSTYGQPAVVDSIPDYPAGLGLGEVEEDDMWL